MLFMHDVWVNWFEGEENGYEVCHFHEWKKSDSIELLDQVPLLKVSFELFDYIENNIAKLPKELLAMVHNKAILRKDKKRINLEYAFVVTNGESELVVDTIGYNIPIRKSRLIPRQSELALDMTKDMSTLKFPVPETHKEYHILSPNPLTMIGLTRRERQLKQLLFMALDGLIGSGNIATLRYHLGEFVNGNMNNKESNELINMFMVALERGWNEKMENLCKDLIKGHPFFEKLYEMSQ